MKTTNIMQGIKINNGGHCRMFHAFAALRQKFVKRFSREKDRETAAELPRIPEERSTDPCRRIPDGLI